VKKLLQPVITGRNTIWSSVAVAVFFGLMLLAIEKVGDGSGILVPFLAGGAATLFMAFRGPPVRPEPVWATRIRQGLAGCFLFVAAGSAAFVGVLVVLHIAR
jgi:hypothetical protein